MNWLIFSFVMFVNVNECFDIQELRDDFHAINSEESLEKFIQEYEDSSCKNATPYIAAATMRRADYCLWPGSKLSYFSEGKDQLESFIQENGASIEGRYVRVLVQSQLPSFLGYSSDMESDCEFIESHISACGLCTKYQAVILQEISSIISAK